MPAQLNDRGYKYFIIAILKYKKFCVLLSSLKCIRALKIIQFCINKKL